MLNFVQNMTVIKTYLEIIFVLVVFKNVTVQSSKCDASQRSLRVLEEGVIGLASTFPWLGVLKVYLREVGSISTALTGIVLVKPEYAISNADDVSKIPKHIFQRDSEAMFIPGDSQPWYCRPKDYITHPEYDRTVNTIALIQLDPGTQGEDRHRGGFPMLPICWPKYPYRTSKELYVVGFTDDNGPLEKVIYKANYLDQKTCAEFYNRANLTDAEMLPVSYHCAIARNLHESCVWDNGMALVSNATGHWVLVGLGVLGPGCESPARYIDMTPHYPWIQTATTRRARDGNQSVGGSETGQDGAGEIQDFDDAYRNDHPDQSHFAKHLRDTGHSLRNNNTFKILHVCEKSFRLHLSESFFHKQLLQKLPRGHSHGPARIPVGLGVLGPGCESPARYIDMTPHYPWIQTATTRRARDGNQSVGGSETGQDGAGEIQDFDDDTLNSRRSGDYIDFENEFAQYGYNTFLALPMEHKHLIDVHFTPVKPRDLLTSWNYPGGVSSVHTEDYVFDRIDKDAIKITKLKGQYGNCSDASNRLIYHDETKIKAPLDFQPHQTRFAVYKISLYDFHFLHYSCVILKVISPSQEQAFLYYRPVIATTDESRSAGTIFSQKTPEEIIKTYTLKQPGSSPQKPGKGWRPGPNLRPVSVQDNADRSIQNVNLYIRFAFFDSASFVIRIYGPPRAAKVQRPTTEKREKYTTPRQL